MFSSFFVSTELQITFVGNLREESTRVHHFPSALRTERIRSDGIRRDRDEMKPDEIRLTSGFYDIMTRGNGP